MSSLLTDLDIAGLKAIQRYRYLTITQYATVSNRSYQTSARTLSSLERRKLLACFGNSPTNGIGRTKKAYYLKKKGYDYLLDECGLSADELGNFRQVKTDAVWKNRMEHRINLVDTMLSFETAFKSEPNADLTNVFLEYFKERVQGGGIQSETTDIFLARDGVEIKIIPDGCFIIESKRTKERFLYFVEVDMGTETIASQGKQYSNSITGKYEKYIEYLESEQFKKKYGKYGDFDFFTMLFVTSSTKRAKNVYNKLNWLKKEYGDYFYISCFGHLNSNQGCLGYIWLQPNSDLITSFIQKQ